MVVIFASCARVFDLWLVRMSSASTLALSVESSNTTYRRLTRDCTNLRHTGIHSVYHVRTHIHRHTQGKSMQALHLSAAACQSQQRRGSLKMPLTHTFALPLFPPLTPHSSLHTAHSTLSSGLIIITFNRSHRSDRLQAVPLAEPAQMCCSDLREF